MPRNNLCIVYDKRRNVETALRQNVVPGVLGYDVLLIGSKWLAATDRDGWRSLGDTSAVDGDLWIYML